VHVMQVPFGSCENYIVYDTLVSCTMCESVPATYILRLIVITLIHSLLHLIFARVNKFFGQSLVNSVNVTYIFRAIAIASDSSLLRRDCQPY